MGGGRAQRRWGGGWGGGGGREHKKKQVFHHTSPPAPPPSRHTRREEGSSRVELNVLTVSHVHMEGLFYFTPPVSTHMIHPRALSSLALVPMATRAHRRLHGDHQAAIAAAAPAGPQRSSPVLPRPPLGQIKQPTFAQKFGTVDTTVTLAWVDVW